jgi:hypothetical protein
MLPFVLSVFIVEGPIDWLWLFYLLQTRELLLMLQLGVEQGLVIFVLGLADTILVILNLRFALRFLSLSPTRLSMDGGFAGCSRNHIGASRFLQLSLLYLRNIGLGLARPLVSLCSQLLHWIDSTAREFFRVHSLLLPIKC